MSTLKCDSLQNTAGTKTIPVSTVVDGSAKAWVNFNGTGVVAIRAAFNVSSITDNGNGNYTLNFANAIADSNYAVMSASTLASDGTKGAVSIYGGYNTPPSNKTASSLQIATGATNSLVLTDSVEVMVGIFR